MVCQLTYTEGTTQSDPLSTVDIGRALAGEHPTQPPKFDSTPVGKVVDIEMEGASSERAAQRTVHELAIDLLDLFIVDEDLPFIE